MNNIQKEAWEKLVNSVEWNTITIDKDIYQEMQEELDSLRKLVKEPDWSFSETRLTSFWKNPAYPMSERLRYADTAIRFRDRAIENLCKKLEDKELHSE